MTSFLNKKLNKIEAFFYYIRKEKADFLIGEDPNGWEIVSVKEEIIGGEYPTNTVAVLKKLDPSENNTVSIHYNRVTIMNTTYSSVGIKNITVANSIVYRSLDESIEVVRNVFSSYLSVRWDDHYDFRLVQNNNNLTITPAINNLFYLKTNSITLLCSVTETLGSATDFTLDFKKYATRGGYSRLLSRPDPVIVDFVNTNTSLKRTGSYTVAINTNGLRELINFVNTRFNLGLIPLKNTDQLSLQVVYYNNDSTTFNSDVFGTVAGSDLDGNPFVNRYAGPTSNASVATGIGRLMREKFSEYLVLYIGSSTAPAAAYSYGLRYPILIPLKLRYE